MKAACKRLRKSPGFAGYAKASLIAGAAAAPASTWANFSGSYTVNPPVNGFYSGTLANGNFGTWTGTLVDAGSTSNTLNTLSAPASVSMDISRATAGADGPISSYTFLVQAAAAGLVSFDYLAQSSGTSSAQYTADGTNFTNLSTGNGTISFNVSLGDTFGFAVRAAYGNNSSLSISNFSAPEPTNGNGNGNGVPEQSSTLALFALGFVGLLSYRLAARRRADLIVGS